MLRFAGVASALVLLLGEPALAEEKYSVFVEPAPVTIAARPLAEGSKPRSISLSRVADSLKYGQAWALILWGKNCSPDSEVTWDAEKYGLSEDAAIERVFRDELTSLKFVVAGDPNNLFKGNEDNGAELQVGALITDWSLMACGGYYSRERKLELDQTTAVGTAQMAIEWQIYSPVESSVIAKIPTVARVEFKDGTINITSVMLDAVFLQNVRALAASEDFRKTVLSSGPSVTALREPTTAPPIVLSQSRAAARPISEAVGSVVALFTGDGMGSGFLVSREGYILTNRHVVGASKYLKVKWSDGVETVGEVVRSDVGRDIALVKSEPRGRQPLALRRGGVQPGDTVFTIGTPLDPRLQGSLTKGVVSANRILEGYSYIQSDVVVNPGNSGGPLLNSVGDVVGVTVSGIGQDKAPRGINFFIPIDDAMSFLSLRFSELPAIVAK